MILAADAGWKHLRKLGWFADAAIGDFDTDAPPPQGVRQTLCKAVIRLPVEKDDTDMAAAARIGLDGGCGAFYLLGGTGGRLDHTLANIQCLARLAKAGVSAYLMDAEQTLTALAGPSSIVFAEGSRGLVSVFAHDEIVEGATISGLKYSLSGARLYNTRALGVSNELTGGEASVSVARGTAVVVFPGTLLANLIRNEA
jgi:thiamine pyrophosphokinase